MPTPITFLSISGPICLLEGDNRSTLFRYRVTRSGSLLGSTVVDWLVTPSSNALGGDFVGGAFPSGTLTFASGEVSKSIDVLVAGDTIPQRDSIFDVSISTPTVDASVVTERAFGFIVDDDSGPITVFDVYAAGAPSDRAPEGTGGFTEYRFYVHFLGWFFEPYLVRWAVTGTGATPASATDFIGGVLPSGVVTVDQSNIEPAIRVMVAADATVEPDESFEVVLTSVEGILAAVNTPPAQQAIVNDDADFAIGALAADQAEGTGLLAGTPFTFRIARTGDTSVAHTVRWRAAGASGTGTVPALSSDFVGAAFPSGVVTFLPGEAERTITLNVLADALGEPDERFAVSLLTPSAGAVIKTATAQGVIRNDDTSLAIGPVSVGKAEGNSGTTAYAFAITRAGALAGNTSVTWEVTGRGAAPATAADFAGGVLPGGTVLFKPGETTAKVTANVAGDTLVEPDEGFGVTLSAATGGATISTATANGTIIADESGFAIAALAATRPEGTFFGGSTPFTFRISRTGDSSAMQAVSWAVTGVAGPGTALATTGDFAVFGGLPAGTATFLPGVTEQTVTVPVSPDQVGELNDRFAVTLSNPTAGAVITTASAQGVILNDDINLSISPPNSTVSHREGNSGTIPFVFNVTRAGTVSGITSVDWQVRAASHPADAADFAGGVLPSGTLTFMPGQTSRTITINVAGDTLVEPTETFLVDLSGATGGATLIDSFAHGRILADETALAIAPISNSSTEGTGGFNFHSFTVTRTGDLALSHSVHWAVSGATGLGTTPADAADFAGGVLPSGELTFLPNQETLPFVVSIATDSRDEMNDRYSVTLSNPSAGASITTTVAGGVILNDDTTTIRLEWPSGPHVVEGTSLSLATNSISDIEVVREGDLSGTTRVDWVVSGIASAMLPSVDQSDFQGDVMPGGTITFNPGEARKPVGFSGIGVVTDLAAEPDEFFQVKLSSPIGAQIVGGSFVEGLLLNDDIAAGTGTLSIARLDAVKREGTGAAHTLYTFTVTRTGDLSGPARAFLEVDPPDFSILEGEFGDVDLGSLNSSPIEFLPRETTHIVTIPVRADSVGEEDETFTVKLTAPAAGVALGASTATGVILNDDTSFHIEENSPNPNIEEYNGVLRRLEGQSGTTDFSFKIWRQGNVLATDSVAWSVSPSTVDAGVPHSWVRTDRLSDAADFVGGVFPTGRVTFAPGETLKVIHVPVAGDTGLEHDEGFKVELSNPSGTAVLVPLWSVNYAIIADDETTFAINPLSVSKPEGTGGPSGTPFTFTITRGGIINGIHAVRWSVSGASGPGTTPATAGDFVGGVLPSQLETFQDGELVKTITVLVQADSAGELNERFKVTLTPGPAVTVITANAEGVILNDDISLAIGPTTVSKVEGNSGSVAYSYTITRAGALAGPTDVNWAVTGFGAAPADAADFAGGVLPQGKVSFLAGQNSKTITFNVAGDTLVEPSEAFRVTLSGATGVAAITTATADGHIRGDEASFSIAALSANRPEGTGGITPFTFEIARAGDSTTTQFVTWSVAGVAGAGTQPATAGDFSGGVLPSGMIGFAPGESKQTVTVNVLADSIGEWNDRFAVTLSNPSVGATIATAVAQGVILNDDISLAITPANSSKVEGNSGSSAFSFTVSRAGQLAGVTSVNWAVTNLGATPAVASDFVGGVLPSGTITFAAGQASRTITVNVAGDTLVEPDEDFRVTLSGATGGAAISTATASGRIVSDDASFAIGPTSQRKAEGTGGVTPFTFTVTRTGGIIGSDSVKWAVAGAAATGSAAATAADFSGGALPSGVLPFGPGVRTASFDVMVQADGDIEADDRFVVTLSDSSAGTVVTGASAAAVIVDDDAIHGTNGNDTLVGTAGPDVFLIGPGLDSITGGLGKDVFRFLPTALGPAASRAATFEDFSRASGELLDLSAIDAIAGSVANDAYIFIGTAAFSGVAGQLRWTDTGATRLIHGDVNGDRTADLTIIVKAAGPVDTGWFVL